MLNNGLLRYLYKKGINLTYVVISFILFITVWDLAVRLSGVNEALFPSPASAFRALLEIIGDGTLGEHVLSSMTRFAVGFILAVTSAVIGGIIIGWFDILFKFTNPIIQLLRPISPIAWMPFIVLAFGIGENLRTHCLRICPEQYLMTIKQSGLWRQKKDSRYGKSLISFR